MPGNLKASIIGSNASVGTPSIITDSMSMTGRYRRQVISQVDTTGRTASSSWVLGPTFATLSGFQAGSILKLFYHVPLRHDSTSWGGAYIEPQISFDSGSTWWSLGCSGYDGVMSNGYANIASYRNELYIDPGQSSTFSATFQFYFRAYTAGTLYWNGSHDVNNVSNTATIMSGDSGLQHWMHLIVHEYALLNP